jgi:hypothetical protein
VKKSAGKSLASILGIKTASSSLVIFQRAGQTINAEYYSSLLVQLKDILEEKRRGKVTKGSCGCTTMPRITGHSKRFFLNTPRM